MKILGEGRARRADSNMVIDNVLLANLFAVSANVVASCEVLHHAILFRVINVLLTVVAKKVAFCLGLDWATWALVHTYFRVCILHVLEVVATRSKTFVTFDANESLLFVLVNNVHAHCRGFLVMAVKAAYGTVNMRTCLFITFDLLSIARPRRFWLDSCHCEKL